MTLPRFRCYIDGALVDTDETFESIDPSTGKPWAVMPAASEADTDRAVQPAHRALGNRAWPTLTAPQLGRLLWPLGDLLAEHAPRLAELETRDTGKIIRETRAQ